MLTVTKLLKSWDGVISLLCGSAGIWCKYRFGPLDFLHNNYQYDPVTH